MHILLLNHSLSFGGAERTIAHLANHWTASGNTVTVATLTSTDTDFYRLDTRVYRIGLALDRVSSTPLAAVSNNARRIAGLRHLLRAQRPDVVVAMMTGTAVLALLASIGLRVPTIVSERVHPPQFPVGTAWNLLRRTTYPLARRVVMQTPKSLAWLQSEIPRARGVVIPNAVRYPLSRAEPVVLPTDVVPKDRKILLAVGRLVRQKGFDLLLDAYAKLALSFPDWHLVILGEGPERAQLEDRALRHKLNQRISLPGVAGNIGDWYEAADAYVLSSRFEGFPNTLAEALAHGCPAISYDCDTGPSELICNRENGLLVSPVGDVGALSEALCQAMGSEQDRALWSRNALSVRDRFSPERVFGTWDAILASVTS